MKTKSILLIVSTCIIILYLILITSHLIKIANLPKQEPYKPPVCGDGICEKKEERYCLDCDLTCKSEELCNSKINILCDNCTETQKKLLPTFFEHQTIVYDCLADYYGYNPPRLIYYNIAPINIVQEPCTKKEGCYLSGMGFAAIEIRQLSIPGLREYGESEVTKQENVGFELHELAHVFGDYELGMITPWFSEGISIYTESRLLCHPNQVLSDKIDVLFSLYRELKKGSLTLDEIAPYDEYWDINHSAPRIGMMYFGALEKDYDCDKECIARILYSLHEYKENCVGECFEDNTIKSNSYAMNLSINNKDLRVQFINNKIIKQKSEEVTGKDLTSLFEMLEIEY